MLHQIGSGVLGPVFRTYEPQRDRLVAVKVFKLDLVPEDVARLAEALRQLVASPTTHPGIVRVLDAGLEGTSPFVAMEYASGESLDVALRDFAPAVTRALPLLIDIGQAIDASWAEDRGHGALHPRDVIVSTGVADTRITGFGITSALESIGARAPVRRPYTAPERVAGEPWDIRADVYSLGAIAHELLTGRRPMGSGEQDGTLAPDLAPEHRVSMRRVIGKALSERPADRYPNAAAFIAELERIAQSAGPLAPVPVAAPSAAMDFFPSEKTVSKPAPESHPPAPRTWHPTSPDAPRPSREPAAPAPPAKPAGRPAPVKTASPKPPAAPASVPAKSGAMGVATGRNVPGKPAQPPPAEAAPKPVPAAPAATVAAAAVAAAAASEAAAIAPREPLRELPASPLVEPPPAAIAPRNSDTRHLSITRVDPDAPAAPAVAAAAVVRPAPAAPVTPHTALGSPRISLGPGAYQPVFSTRDTSFDSRSFPWAAIAVAVLAALIAGGVGGYLLGARSARPVSSQATAGKPAGQTATDVPVTAEPSSKPSADTPPVASRPSGPTAAVQKPGSRSTPPATRVSDVRGRIIVRSVPAGAIVTVDGRLYGETPLTVRDLVLGAHSVQIAHPGYVPRTDRITLTSGAPSQTVSAQLEPGVDTAKAGATQGSVFVDTRPRGARVTIDGRDAGVTPVQIPEVSLGPHKITIELAGYKTLNADVVVTPGPPTKFAVTLEQVR